MRQMRMWHPMGRAQMPATGVGALIIVAYTPDCSANSSREQCTEVPSELVALEGSPHAAVTQAMH